MESAGSISGKLLRPMGVLLLTCALLAGQTNAQSQNSQHSSAANSHKNSHKSKRSRKASWRRGQQKVDPQRAREIQEALIRQHYLKGEPTGRWDDATQRAMQRYQSDNGWQIKTIPDSRALIKLGLGPNHDHLLNPESAMTSAPQGHGSPNPAADSSQSPHQK